MKSEEAQTQEVGVMQLGIKNKSELPTRQINRPESVQIKFYSRD